MATTTIPESPTLSEDFFANVYEIADGERIKACLQCGYCSGVCPFGYLMDFPPGRMIAFLRANLFERVLDNDSVWMCISCYACTEACPVKIPVTAGLMTHAKEEILLAGNVPTELQSALQFSQRYGNPIGRISSQAR